MKRTNFCEIDRRGTRNYQNSRPGLRILAHGKRLAKRVGRRKNLNGHQYKIPRFVHCLQHRLHITSMHHIGDFSEATVTGSFALTAHLVEGWHNALHHLASGHVNGRCRVQIHYLCRREMEWLLGFYMAPHSCVRVDQSLNNEDTHDNSCVDLVKMANCKSVRCNVPFLSAICVFPSPPLSALQGRSDICPLGHSCSFASLPSHHLPSQKFNW
jgi:hypothetical protein